MIITISQLTSYSNYLKMSIDTSEDKLFLDPENGPEKVPENTPKNAPEVVPYTETLRITVNSHVAGQPPLKDAELDLATAVGILSPTVWVKLHEQFNKMKEPLVASEINKACFDFNAGVTEMETNGGKVEQIVCLNYEDLYIEDFRGCSAANYLRAIVEQCKFIRYNPNNIMDMKTLYPDDYPEAHRLHKKPQ